ncbi:hypothetical protein Scep_000779 [Stephania cephalantha]|uniref:HVA22-like protein n=1 Tax=Stephania cephalantha TaxID=152367 RepID=A0AAP0L870_9MAGN
MALLGSSLTTDVGLRLLLFPLNSNIVIRTACCSVGIVLPVYNTFKAIENKDQNEQQKWLYYWAVYGSFSIAEVFSDKILSWFPLYYHLKFVFLVWLQLPSADGAKLLYLNHIRPFLLRHQARLDQVLGAVYGEMVKCISEHQAEIKFVKTLLLKITGSAAGMMRDILHPAQPQRRRAIEASPRPNEDSESDHED